MITKILTAKIRFVFFVLRYSYLGSSRKLVRYQRLPLGTKLPSYYLGTIQVIGNDAIRRKKSPSELVICGFRAISV